VRVAGIHARLLSTVERTPTDEGRSLEENERDVPATTSPWRERLEAFVDDASLIASASHDELGGSELVLDEACAERGGGKLVADDEHVAVGY
jgi:hypothetical protein